MFKNKKQRELFTQLVELTVESIDLVNLKKTITDSRESAEVQKRLDENMRKRDEIADKMDHIE